MIAAGAAAPPDAGAVLTVDLAAVRSNYRSLRARAAPAALAAVVKADGYGLGARPIAAALEREGCRQFFVAHLAEARALLPALSPAATVFVLNGLMPGAEDEAAARPAVVPVLNSLPQLDAWAAAARRAGRLLPAALHVDTGMSRLGLSLAEALALAERPAALAGVDLRLVLSHLAAAEEAANPTNGQQLARVAALRGAFGDVPLSLGNSSAVFLGPLFAFDLLRPGAALFGINPTPDRPNPMRPVLRLSARVIQTRVLAAGDPVGYGGEFVASRPTAAAAVALGYGDGWPRGARTAAFFEGTRLPILGRVSMDTIVLDLSALPAGGIEPGRCVDFLCPEQTPDDVAAATGTIGYEILCGLGHRPCRVYADAGS